MSLQHAVSQKDPRAVKLCLLYGAAKAPTDSQLDSRVYVADTAEAGKSEPQLTPLYNAVAQYQSSTHQEKGTADQETGTADQENATTDQEKSKTDQENARTEQKKSKTDQENARILDIVEALEALEDTDEKKEERPFASLSGNTLDEFLGDYYRMKSKEKMLAERLRETIQKEFEPVHREVLEMVKVFKSQMKKCLLCGELPAACAAKPCNCVFCCELCMKVLTRGGLTNLQCPVCSTAGHPTIIENMIAVTWDDASVTREFFEHGVVNGPGGA